MTNCIYKNNNDTDTKEYIVERVFQEYGIDLVIFHTVKGTFNHDPRRHCVDLYTFSNRFKLIEDKG